MMTAALILAPMMSGNTEASTTRRPCAPRTRSSGSTTAMSSFAGPILQVPQGWWVVTTVLRTKLSNSASVLILAPGAIWRAMKGFSAGFIATSPNIATAVFSVRQSMSAASRFWRICGCANGSAEASVMAPRLSGRSTTMRQAKLSSNAGLNGGM
mgnify:CR=1 FL=1